MQPSWISAIDIKVTKPRLEEQKILVLIFKMIISIHYCYLIRGTWPRWRQRDKCPLCDIWNLPKSYFTKNLHFDRRGAGPMSCTAYRVWLTIVLTSTIDQSSAIWDVTSPFWVLPFAAWQRWFREVCLSRSWLKYLATVGANKSKCVAYLAFDRVPFPFVVTLNINMIRVLVVLKIQKDVDKIPLIIGLLVTTICGTWLSFKD